MRDSASCDQSQYVVLRIGEGIDRALGAEVHKDLAAELEPRGFCVLSTKAEGGEWAADILLAAAGAESVTIEVDDFTTGKRVWRDVSLTKIPAGGAALALAIAIDELLRASWAELSLREGDHETPSEPSAPGPDVRAPDRPAPRPSTAQPAAPAPTLEEHETAPAQPHRARRGPPTGRGALVLVGSYSHTLHAWDAGALELRGQGRIARWGFLEGAVGVVRAHDVGTAYGDVRARGISASLTGGLCWDRGRSHLCGGPRLSVQWTDFRGRHPAGAEARRNDLAAVIASCALQLAVDLGTRARLLWELAPGGAVHGAEATDASTTLVGLSGFVLSVGMGLGVRL